jgi:hypothetical protein
LTASDRTPLRERLGEGARLELASGRCVIELPPRSAGIFTR